MELKLSEVLHFLPVLAIFVFNIQAISGTCDPPTASDLSDYQQVGQVSTAQTEYVIDSVIAFSCLSGNGWGYFKLTCEGSGSSGMWAGRSRDCEDTLPFDYGSLAGIMCALFTLLVCVFLIIMSTRLKYKRAKEEQMELKIMEETVGATKA